MAWEKSKVVARICYNGQSTHSEQLALQVPAAEGSRCRLPPPHPPELHALPASPRSAHHCCLHLATRAGAEAPKVAQGARAAGGL